MTPVAHGEELLTVREAADRLRVSEKTARRLIAGADLPAVQFNGPRSTVRVPTAALEAWLTEQRVSAMGRDSFAAGESASGRDSFADAGDMSPPRPQTPAAHVRDPEAMGSRTRTRRAGDER
jgi:excisionase family DNA binding protein